MKRGSAEAEEVIRQLEGLSRNFQRKVDRLSLIGNMPGQVTREQAEAHHLRQVEIEAAAAALSLQVRRPQVALAAALRVEVERQMLPGDVTFQQALDRAAAGVLEKVRTTGRL